MEFDALAEITRLQRAAAKVWELSTDLSLSDSDRRVSQLAAAHDYALAREVCAMFTGPKF